jgi:hypothetical protein
MNYLVIDTFAYRLKEALDSALAHGEVVMFNFYTYKAIDPVTGQPPQLQVPYVAVDIPPGGTISYHRKKPNVWQQPVIDRTRLAIQVGGRQLVELGGVMTGGFDTDILPLVTAIKNFIEQNPSLTAPAALTDFAGRKIGVMFDQPSDQAFRVKDHEGHIFYVIVEEMTTTKEA